MGGQGKENVVKGSSQDLVKQEDVEVTGKTYMLPVQVWASLAMAFLAGSVLMSLEIVGGRMVAARFGSHVFVWGAVIGIFMGSLSLGYYLGGRASDRFPRLSGMGGLTILSGIAVILVPFIIIPVCGLVRLTVFPNNLELAGRFGPLVAITLVFTFPSVLLGAITPYTIRLLADDAQKMGRLAGRIYALNALGSILGTLLTAFFFMGIWRNSTILIFSGVLLIVVGATLAGLERLPAENSQETLPENSEIS